MAADDEYFNLHYLYYLPPLPFWSIRVRIRLNCLDSYVAGSQMIAKVSKGFSSVVFQTLAIINWVLLLCELLLGY